MKKSSGARSGGHGDQETAPHSADTLQQESAAS
jgi:hypothetical protein